MASEEDIVQRWHELERDGTRLACADFGGTGTPVMLLHGLAGHATEWAETASWLTDSHHVFAPDLRGHGRSERRPDDVSRDAHGADVAAWIEHFGFETATLVGQSLGGHTAFLVAACWPDCVEKLVVAEASPGPVGGEHASSEADETIARVKRWLESWPTPFPSREAATVFFGRNPNWAQAWADGLEQRRDGFYPSFDADMMVATLTAATGSYWAEWSRIECPTLVVVITDHRAEPIELMLAEQPHASLAEVPEAGHDLHLDNPAGWRAAIEDFIE
jgi:pimeloyl-ACP methyl ester carboxylesterase